LFSFDSVNAKTGLLVNNSDKFKKAIASSSETIKNFIGYGTPSYQPEEANTESNSISTLNDNSAYFTGRIDTLTRENQDLKD